LNRSPSQRNQPHHHITTSASTLNESLRSFKIPASQTLWQEIRRSMIDALSNGMVPKPAVKYRKIDETKGVPRDNH